jgi:hypothetical protein
MATKPGLTGNGRKNLCTANASDNCGKCWHCRTKQHPRLDIFKEDPREQMDVNEHSIARKPHAESVSLHSLISGNRIDAESIVQTVREAILILTPDLRVCPDTNGLESRGTRRKR